MNNETNRNQEPVKDQPADASTEAPVFTAPRLVTRGTLPVVTTAFGGTFTP